MSNAVENIRPRPGGLPGGDGKVASATEAKEPDSQYEAWKSRMYLPLFLIERKADTNFDPCFRSLDGLSSSEGE